MKTILSLVACATLLVASTDETSVSEELAVPVASEVSESAVQKVAESTSVAVTPVIEEPKTVAQESTDNSKEYVIQNSPYLQKASTITITATGVGVVPASTISTAQGIALANRAAIVDAYRQMGEKMHGVHLTAEDSIKNMVVQSTHVRAKVASIVKNSSVIDSTFHNGLYQVTMQIKLDGNVWHNYLEQL